MLIFWRVTVEYASNLDKKPMIIEIAIFTPTIVIEMATAINFSTSKLAFFFSAANLIYNLFK